MPTPDERLATVAIVRHSSSRSAPCRRSARRLAACVTAKAIAGVATAGPRCSSAGRRLRIVESRLGGHRAAVARQREEGSDTAALGTGLRGA